MNTAVLTAMSGVLGTLVGGTVTFATTWVSQRTLGRRELLREEIKQRESLYSEFIVECARLLMDALSHGLEKPETLVPAYSLINRIRLCASKPVLVEAENLARRITDQYFSPNMTLEEMRRIANSEEADALRPFGEACRAELQTLRARF
jgi:hypothetical protein